MAEIIVEERVVNKIGESGVITAFDGQYITVVFPNRKAMFKSDAFEQGHIQYENAQLQEAVLKNIARINAEKEKETEQNPVAEEKTKVNLKPVQNSPRQADMQIKFETIQLGLDVVPANFRPVKKEHTQLMERIFSECDKDIQALYESFRPVMQYPKYTSHSRSKYCTGFLGKYCDTYVFRVFSRNDVYKKRVRTGITVMESNTSEVLRVICVNGKVYCFSKNICFGDGRYNNTTACNKWAFSNVGGNVFLNEVICNCDCGYLNGYVSNRVVNAEASLFVNLLFLALTNNKAEIVFKNKAFTSTYRIDNLVAFLEEYTTKQIDFASKNNVMHALPFIKRYGISDVDLLRDLEGAMRKRRGESAYGILKELLSRWGYDQSEADRRLMHFIKKVEHFNAAVYGDYLSELRWQPRTAVTVQDIFDPDYVERHNDMRAERMARYAVPTSQKEDVQKEIEEYSKIAKELSWIDREENGYFIMIPKTIADFRTEGGLQHNCVYKMRYHRFVIARESIIVFLRQEKDTPYVTIEFDYKTFEVLQALGKYNKKIDPELYQYIVDLGKRLYYEMHSHQ